MCVRWRVHATSNCDRQARSPGRQALPLRPSCARRPAARLPRRLPRDRLPAPAGQGRSCTRASPRTRPSTPTPFEPVDEGTLVWLRKSPLVDRRARRALRVRRRAGPTSVRPSSWHRYRKTSPGEQAHPEDVDVARRLRGRRQRRQGIHLLLHVRGRCHRAEAVFIGGNGFRAARAVHHLECRTGRLVLEANHFLLWSILEKAGAPVAVRAVGMLFDDRQPDGNKIEER